MKILLMLGVVAMVAVAEAETPAKIESPMVGQRAEPAPGVKLAEAVSSTTGLAISPLLGVGAVGVWQYWRTPSSGRDGLPWYASPWFWVPALGVVGLLAMKEPALYFFPGAKKPLDLLEVLENKVSALVAAPVVIHLAIEAFSQADNVAGGTRVVAAGWTMDGWFGVALGACGLMAIFFCVWLVAHAVNVLILLSPSATIDMVMRGGRGLVLGAVTVSAAINPWIGLLVAVVVIYMAARLSGWAWRLMLFGGTLAFDWLGGKKTDAPDHSGRVRAFLARPSEGLPNRTRGHLQLSVTGELVFVGRAMPWQKQKAVVFDAAEVRLARGLTGPVLQAGASPFSGKLASLPPRYSGAEMALGRVFGIGASAEHPVQRTWTGVLEWLREAQGGGLVKSIQNRSRS